MKKILVQFAALFSFIIPYFADATSSFVGNNLSGKYNCTGYDRQDKALRCSLIITLNTKNSILKNGYSAYRIKLAAPFNLRVKGLPPKIAATGSIAANGN